MEDNQKKYVSGFVPYGLAAFLVGIVGGFSSVLGPAFVKDVGIAYNNTTWTALATAVSTAACAPILGKLGDVIGRRTTLLLGIVIFTAGNILTAIAPALFFMLVARFIVGIGTAAIAPVVISYIVTEFPPAAMAKGFSVYMLISSGAVIFGPTLGGLIIRVSGWRTMVWVCVAICVAIFFACLFIKEETHFEKRPIEGFDGLGAVFVLIFFSLVLCVPSFGQNFGWNSGAFLIVTAAAILSLAGLVFVEKRATNPILQGSFMKRKTFILTVIALFLTQGLMQANMTNTIVFVNYTQPENTLISSYAISAMYIGMSLGAIILGPLADKYEPKTVLLCSFVLTGAGCALMLFFTGNASVFLLAGSLGILGFGLGGNGTIFMKVVLSGIPAETAGAGTGTYGLFRDISAPFGVAVFVPMFTNSITARINGVRVLEAEEIYTGATAAISAVRMLGIVEIFCVILGIVVVFMLPKVNNIRNENS